MKQFLKREFEKWCLEHPHRKCPKNNGNICALAKFIKDKHKDDPYLKNVYVGTHRVTYTFHVPAEDFINGVTDTSKLRYKYARGNGIKFDVDYVHTTNEYWVRVEQSMPPWARVFVRYFDKLSVKMPTAKHAFQILCEFS